MAFFRVLVLAALALAAPSFALEGGGGHDAVPPAESVETTPAAPTRDEVLAFHFQATIATQAHPAFHALYSGNNSMQPTAEMATSIVTDAYGGVRLWKGAQLYLQPELAGGAGLSSTLGVADFPSGEVYRVGSPAPTLIVGRLFLRQVIGLGGGTVSLPSGPNQLGTTQDRDTLTLTVGKVAVTDFVDRNGVSNDPHTGFMSWGLFASAAYDYPADTRGYTWGVAADLALGRWSLRGGVFLEPTTANGLDMEWNLAKARGIAAEGEVRYSLFGHPGAARLLGFLNDAHMGSYALALSKARDAGVPPDIACACGPAQRCTSVPDLACTRAYGRTKAGFAASADQELGRGASAFLRVSYNDGQNETWAFTEVDHSVAAGVVQSGARWGRPEDTCGVGLVVSGISDIHRTYLASGGYGFIIGDGALRYGLEVLGEVYYLAALTPFLWVGVNYQPVFDPAFNQDRGPINVFTARVHAAF